MDYAVYNTICTNRFEEDTNHMPDLTAKTIKSKVTLFVCYEIYEWIYGIRASMMIYADIMKEYSWTKMNVRN